MGQVFLRKRHISRVQNNGKHNTKSSLYGKTLGERKKLRAMPHNSSSLLLIWGGLEGSRRQASGPDYGRLSWLCYMKYKDPPSVVGPVPCSGILDCTKRRKWTKCHHLLFSPWLQLNTTNCFKTPWLPLHGGWHLKLSQDKPSLCQGAFIRGLHHNNRKVTEKPSLGLKQHWSI